MTTDEKLVGAIYRTAWAIEVNRPYHSSNLCPQSRVTPVVMSSEVETSLIVTSAPLAADDSMLGS